MGRDNKTEKHLKENSFRLSLFEAILENAGEECYLVKPGGQLVYVNRAAAQSLGYTVEEMLSIGVPGFDLKFGPVFESLFMELKVKNVPPFETIHTAKDGRKIPKEIKAVYMSFGDEEYVCGFGRDTTERKAAEEELHRRERQFSLIANNFPGIVSRLDRNLVFTFSIRGYEPVSEIVPKNVIGQSLRDVIGRKTWNIAQPYIKQALTGEQVSFENTHTLPSGKTFSVLNTLVPDLDSEDNVEGIFTFAIDITKRKEAEQALLESEERYRRLYEGSRDGIVRVDMHGNILEFNQSYQAMLGYTKEEIEGKNYRQFTLSRWLEAEEQILSEQTKKKGYSEVYEKEYVRKDGSIFPVELRTFLINKKGKNIGMWAIVRDIEERKKVEQNLMQAHKMQAIGTLAGGIAHDFNNILAGILGYAQIIKKKLPENSPLNSYIQQIFRMGDRAVNLIDQILAFSRKTDIQPKPLLLSLIIKESLKMLHSTIPAHISIDQKIFDTESTVLADPAQIHQVLMNLFSNAAYELQETGGVIEVVLKKLNLKEENIKKYPGLKPGHFLSLTVRDTGSGIDGSIKDRIFDPFFTTKPVGSGTGMGLAVVHGIVESLNGVIRVESAIEKGTTFQIILPVSKLIENVHTDAEDTKKIAGGSESIMIIDDEESLTFTFGKILAEMGYRIKTENKSMEALNDFEQNPACYDLIITDMSMPQMTGFELAKRIMDIRPEMPLIICTGHSDVLTEEKIQKAGIKALLKKPVTAEKLLKTVRYVLDENKIK